MSFAGKVWRLLVGIKDALALLFLLVFFAALFALLSSRPSPGMVHKGALLLALDGVVVEETSQVDPFSVLLSGSLPMREYAARDLVHAIDEAASDERIEAIALDLSTFVGGGQVHMAAIGDALDRFRAADKPVYAYAIAYTDDTLMLAAHADEVWVDPMGGALIRGPGGHTLYYGDALQRFGIKAKVYRAGEYKSFAEPYTRGSMSDEARANLTPLYQSLWEEWQAHVKKARPQADIDLVTGSLDDWIAASDGNLAQAAVDAGIADTIGTREDFGARVAEEVGKDQFEDMPGSFAHTALDPWLAEVAPTGDAGSAFGSGAKRIGVITVAGTIQDGQQGPGEAGAARISDLLDDALDDDLAALVVRVDSPGGTVSGSEAIRRALARHKEKGIPIAISMGNVAASGGYWIATTGDRIFAEPETITGSIGVIAIVPTFEDLLAEYDVHSDGIRTTPLSGQPDILGGFNAETETLLQASVDAQYSRFLNIVSTARGMTKERADELAQGQVWDGGTARQIGLVDQFGDLDAALAWAAGQAGLKEGEWQPKFLGQDKPESFASMVAAMFTDEPESEARSASPRDLVAFTTLRESALTGRLLADVEALFAVRGGQARCLDCATLDYSAPKAQDRGLMAALGALLSR